MFLTASFVVEIADDWETVVHLGKFIAVVISGYVLSLFQHRYSCADDANNLSDSCFSVIYTGTTNIHTVIFALC